MTDTTAPADTNRWCFVCEDFRAAGPLTCGPDCLTTTEGSADL